ncbi:polyketide cyclase [Proteus sp. G2669]|uniref:polyketide cyclase n=1 Tax=Proteus sp. G2669 TaxID=2698881 RepID=UPI0014123D89|nr:polyketide cyclase [Proteus sp. G2669]NBM56748.1 polyketide cyclase [Proteus sp. G2669]
MATLNIKATFQCDIEKLWQVITLTENYQWRSDLRSIEVINDHKFIEHTKDGYSTIFTVTAKVPYQRWEFDMENENIKGHWMGVFTSDNGITEIDFTEVVISKKIFLKPLVKWYLKKRQKTYIQDLEKALANKP